MKFAIVAGERIEAQPGQSGVCPGCGQTMTAKCGEIKIWHWAHRGVGKCDPWWESETEWHRGWKNQFPKEWQEIIRRDPDGEKHIADVLTESGMVLEFQHSALRRDEREARERFYQKMAWVVNGRRRVRDRAYFFDALRTASYALHNPLTLEIRHAESALLRDWAPSGGAVFFDFGDASEPDDCLRFDTPILWRVMPDTSNGSMFVSPVPKAAFIRAYLTGMPLGGFNYPAAAQVIVARARTFTPPINRLRPGAFPAHMARQYRARSRFRF